MSTVFRRALIEYLDRHYPVPVASEEPTVEQGGKTLSNLVAGDSVFLLQGMNAKELSRCYVHIAQVESVSRTHVRVAGVNWRRSDGHSGEKAQYRDSHIEPYDPEKHDPIVQRASDERDRVRANQHSLNRTEWKR